jgi:hypothetical protein
VGVAGAYAYYPSPEDAFRDMQIIKADFHGELADGAPATAPLHHLDLWDRQAEKLPAGAWIRLRPPSQEARERTRELRQGLQALRDAVELGHMAEARRLFLDLRDSNERCRAAYALR